MRLLCKDTGFPGNNPAFLPGTAVICLVGREAGIPPGQALAGNRPLFVRYFPFP